VVSRGIEAAVITTMIAMIGVHQGQCDITFLRAGVKMIIDRPWPPKIPSGKMQTITSGEIA
jgi:hypothetical protein